MVIVMDMQSGIPVAGSVGYDDEVLNAGWLPQPELQLQVVESTHSMGREPRAAVDPDEFLRNLYAAQE